MTLYVLYGSAVALSVAVDLRSFTGRLVAFAQPSDGPISAVIGGTDVTEDGVADIVVGLLHVNNLSG
eukprot:gene4258-5041_t